MVYFLNGQEHARAKIDALTSIVEKGFAASDRRFGAIAEDIADIKREMATKDQIVALHGQVNSIETELRGMKHTKLHARVANLEEKVFGAARD